MITRQFKRIYALFARDVPNALEAVYFKDFKKPI